MFGFLFLAQIPVWAGCRLLGVTLRCSLCLFASLMEASESCYHCVTVKKGAEIIEWQTGTATITHCDLQKRHTFSLCANITIILFQWNISMFYTPNISPEINLKPVLFSKAFVFYRGWKKVKSHSHWRFSTTALFWSAPRDKAAISCYLLHRNIPAWLSSNTCCFA